MLQDLFSQNQLKAEESYRTKMDLVTMAYEHELQQLKSDLEIAISERTRGQGTEREDCCESANCENLEVLFSSPSYQDKQLIHVSKDLSSERLSIRCCETVPALLGEAEGSNL